MTDAAGPPAPPPLASVAATAQRLWAGKTSGAVARLALVLLGVPVVLTLAFGRNPPLGIFLNGILVGSLYSLLAIGLILIYRTNRIISFAQAGLGAVPAIAGLLMFQRWNLPYALAVVVVVVGALALGAAVEFTIIRRFQRSPRLILTLATVGLAQFLAFVELFLPRWISIRVTRDTARASLQSVLSTPFGQYGTDIGGVRFTLDHLITVFVVIGLTFGLVTFLRRSRMGLAARAVAENVERISLLGVPVGRVTTVVWMIAAVLSAAGVFLRAHLTYAGIGGFFGAGGLVGPNVLLAGLAAAVIARMERLPTAFVAGLAVGMIDQAAFYSLRNASLSTSLQLPIILVALLFQRGRASRAESTGVATWEAAKDFRPIPRELRRVPEVIGARMAIRIATIAFFVLLPFIVGEFRQNLVTIGIAYALVGISVVVLTGWAGQISLGQFGLFGAGAAIAGSIAVHTDVNFLLALVIAGLGGSGIAILVGIPALRLEGLHLAVTTLAFAAAMQAFFLNPKYFGWFLPESQEEVERPLLLGRLDFSGELSYYYLCLVILALAIAAATGLRASQQGRVLLAARDNERSAQAFGINLARMRLAAFAISGFFAALGGGLFVYLQRAFNPTRFTPSDSIEVFAMVVIGGLTSVSGAITGAVYIVGFRYFLPDYSLLATGLGMLFLLLFFPGGLSEVGFRLRDAFLRRVAIRRGIVVPSLVADVATTPAALPPEDAKLFNTIDADASDDVDRAPVPEVAAR